MRGVYSQPSPEPPRGSRINEIGNHYRLLHRTNLQRDGWRERRRFFLGMNFLSSQGRLERLQLRSKRVLSAFGCNKWAGKSWKGDCENRLDSVDRISKRHETIHTFTHTSHCKQENLNGCVCGWVAWGCPGGQVDGVSADTDLSGSFISIGQTSSEVDACTLGWVDEGRLSG